MSSVGGKGAGAAVSLLAALSVFLVTGIAEGQYRRVDLNVLVISADDVGTAMVKAGLDEGLVPYTEVDLTAENRPLITDAFLADRPSVFVRRAKYQAIVLPNEAPEGLGAAELAALTRYQREYRIRRLDAYVYPSPAVGMAWPLPGYVGPLDGMTGQVTPAARGAGFDYLVGPVPFENLDPGVAETYGALALPLPADTVNRRSFTPFVTMQIPESNLLGVLVGVYNDDGREEMIITNSMNQYQLQQQVLMPGIIEWLTYGVHLGTAKNFFSVHIDDIFLGDARWSVASNCTVGDDCPANVTAPDIIMTPADVDYLVAWQQRQGMKLDMVFNGGGYDQAITQPGGFPLGTRLLASRTQLRWVNHTYTHMNLGCIKDFSVVPWRCATDSRGRVQWVPYASVYAEINNNINFASRFGLSIDRSALVTGEHSGLRRAPEEPSDNPNLVSALTSLRMGWIGSDNSRESEQRVVGSARTVPRYPMNIFYNVGTKAEQTDEYNWIYTSRANGGSGICENNPSSTCIAPLDLTSGFDSYIVPLEARIALLHVVSNTPRPHYAHQSNLAEDRILYPVLDRLLATYRSLFTASAGIVNPTITEAGNEFRDREIWGASRGRVTAYVQNGDLIIGGAGFLTTYRVPVTVPGASRGGAGLTAYAGARTGWAPLIAPFPVSIDLPTSVGYAR